MKVLENENNKPIMWIQIHDIIALNERHITLPLSKRRINYILKNLNLYESNDFIPFEEQREINLLKAYDFIISYEELMKYSEEELQERIKRLERQIIATNNLLKNRDKYEEIKSKKLFLLKYQFQFIKLNRFKELLTEKRRNRNYEIARTKK